MPPLDAAFTRFFFADEPVATLDRFRRGLALWTGAWALVHLPHADELYCRPVLREGIYDRWLGGPPPPLALVAGLGLALLVGLALVLADRRAHRAQWLVLAAFAGLYVFDAGRLRAYTTLALVQWSLLVLAPAAPKTASAPRWVARLLMLQVSAVYFFAALTKLVDGSGWRDGAAIARIFGSSRYGKHLLSSWFPAPGLWTLAAVWAVLALELFIAFGLWHRRTRLAAAAGLVLLHLGIALTMKVSLLFHALMLLQLALFAPLRPAALRTSRASS